MTSPNQEPLKQSELRQFFSAIGLRMQTNADLAAPTSSSQSVGRSGLERFFTDVYRQVELREQLDQRLATSFNVFDLIDPDENKLSDILKILLDPKGNHGQGDLFLRLLIEKLDAGLSAEHTRHATVQREAPTHGIMRYRRRLDVLVSAGDLVAIENKVDSSEQKEQAKDYLDHLRYCTRAGGKRFVLIYLTPNGRRPGSLDRFEFKEAQSNGSLHCWGYQKELRDWLEACRSGCRAPKITAFLGDFIAHIRSALKRETETNREEEADEN